MKKRMKSVLLELLKDSSRSDRQIAKALGVSQPTVSRMRTKLVNEGVIKEFTVIPDFAKMGYEIMAISCVKLKPPATEILEKGMQWIKTHRNILFAADGEGMGKNGVVISLHKNYTDFSKFVSKSLQYWGEEIQDYDTMLVSLKGIIAKHFSLKQVAELEETY